MTTPPRGVSGSGRKWRHMAGLLCGVAALALTAIPARAADDSLKILTLNTWGDRFRANPSLIDDFFINGNFDVMTFQEFNGNYNQYLPGMLESAGLGVHKMTKVGDVGVITRVPGTLGSFSTGGLNTQGRHISFTKTDARGALPQTVIGTVHLDYADTSTGRIREAKALNQWVSTQAGPVILTGDFNAGDVSERGLHSVSQQELLLRTYVRGGATNTLYRRLLDQYAKDPVALNAYIAEWRGKPAAQINASTVPAGLFEPETSPVADNLPQTMNILKKKFQLLQTESEREQFVPHEFNDGSSTWPSAGEDATNVWASWHRVKIDHFLASRPFGKWWMIDDDENDRYSGVIKDVYVTNPDGSKTPLSDHEPVAHTLRWIGPALENYDEVADGVKSTKTRVVWGEKASKFEQNDGEFFLTRNNMRNDVYLGQVSNDDGMPLLTGLTEQEKKTLLDCKSTDSRFQQAIRDYCIDDHSFIGELLVTDNGTVVVEEDAALGGSQAKLRLDGGNLRIVGQDMNYLNRNIVLEGTGGAIDIADENNIVRIGREISGTGGLTKQGLGALVLQGDHSYSGETSVDKGLLFVDGSIAASSLTTVRSGATLAGTGTMGTTVVAAGGILAPGNSIGALKVAGDITFEKDSVFQVEANAAGESDKVSATGKAILQGGSVLTLAANGTYAPQTAYTILTANEGVEGKFADVTSNLAFLASALDYSAKNVTLTLTRNDVSFADVVTSSNQRSVATAAEGLGGLNPVYIALVNLDEGQAGAAFDKLSGEVHASSTSMLIEDTLLLRDAVTSRVHAAFGEGGRKSLPVLAYGEGGPQRVDADTDRFVVWGETFGSWGKVKGDGNVAGFNRNTSGLVVGGDALFGDASRLGLMAGYSHANFNAKDRASSGEAASYHIGLYGGTHLGGLGLSGGVAYSWNRVETTRSVTLPNFGETLSAKYDAGVAQVFGEASYKVEAGRLAFEPFANLAYVSLHTNGFAETGGAAALSAAAQTTDATFMTLGVRAAHDLTLGSIDASARGMLGWRHAFGNTAPSTTLAFTGDNAFAVTGVPIASNSAIVEAGLDLKLTESAIFGVAYNGQFASATKDHRFNAKLGVKF